MLIYSNESASLFEDFLEKRFQYECNEARLSSHTRAKRLTTLSADINKYSFLPRIRFSEPENIAVKVKSDIFRYPTILAHDLRISLGLK